MASYHEYLELDQLLSMQRPRTEYTATELAFIVVHQVSELWFKLVIDDIRGTIDRLCVGDDEAALRRLRRVHEVERLLVDQLVLIDHLPPGGFGALRPALGSASAAESRQFAMIERLSVPHPVRGAQPADDLWTALCLRLAEDGHAMPIDDTDEGRTRRRRVLLDVYRDAGPASSVCEALLDHDHAFTVWRQRHALAVARQIGDVPGTGGTGGVAYLQRRCDRRFYPELWSVRADLTSPAGQFSS